MQRPLVFPFLGGSGVCVCVSVRACACECVHVSTKLMHVSVNVGCVSVVSTSPGVLTQA